MIDPGERYTKVEAADLLGVSMHEIDDLIASGELPSVKAGRTFLVSRRDVERLRRRPK